MTRETLPSLDETTQRFLDSADKPNTTPAFAIGGDTQRSDDLLPLYDAPPTVQPFVRAMPTHDTFPASAIATTDTWQEAQAIARITRAFMAVPLDAKRIEEIITTPPGHFSPLMQTQSIELMRAMLKAQMAAFEAEEN